MKLAVTMSDVAREVGVHQSTVSRALKNDRRLPQETRERILEVARKLGYKPNPLVSALIAARKKNKISDYGSTIAFLTSHSSRSYWLNSSPRCNYFYKRLEAHLESRGYSLEEFWLRDPGMTPERMQQILHYRGIYGIIVCPLPLDTHMLDFDFTDFAGVALGTTLWDPQLDHVTIDYARIAKECLDRLFAAGFTRIGYLTSKEMCDRTDNLAIGAYLSARRLRSECLYDPVIFPWGKDQERIARWVAKNRPEVLVFPTRTELLHVKRALEPLGIQIPKDVSAVCMDCYSDSDESGMIQDVDEQAAALAELVTNKVERGVFGVPNRARTISVGGVWKEGTTLAPRSQAKSYLPEEQTLRRTTKAKTKTPNPSM